MLICPKCKTQYDNSSRFCKKDGSKLVQMYEEEPIEVEYTIHEDIEEETVSERLDEHKTNLINNKENSMATWKQVRDFIQSNYNGVDYDEEYDFLDLDFNTGNDRVKKVFVERIKNETNTTEWIEISAIVGEVNKNDIFDLLEDLSGYVCGGAVKNGDNIYIRNRILIDSIDSSSIDNIMGLVAFIASELEDKYAE